jgi:hypothetical protein
MLFYSTGTIGAEVFAFQKLRSRSRRREKKTNRKQLKPAGGVRSTVTGVRVPAGKLADKRRP